ncbi:MAG: DUF4097 family beta strand repeat-containing protein [Clostridia bacterium]
MKNKKLWCGIIILFIAGLIVATIGFCMGGARSLYIDEKGVNIMQKDFVNEIVKIDLDKFSELSVNASSQIVEVIASDKYALELDCRNPEKISYTLENDKLTVKNNSGFMMDFNFGINMKADVIRIYLPTEAVLNKLDAKVTSGKIIANDQKTKELVLSVNSGTAEINNIVSEKGVLKVTSGNVTVNNSNFEKLETSVISGKMKLFDITSNELLAKVTSGNLEANGELLGNVNVNVTSGSAKLSLKGSSIDYSKKLKATSGNVVVDNIKTTDVYTEILNTENTLDLSTTSGAIKVDFEN